MSNPFKKVLLRTAKQKTNKFDMSNYHQTTGHFFSMNVNYIQELVPGSKIDFSMNTFSRLAPMPSPTIGNVKIVNRQFFVPFRCVMPNWNDFISQNSNVSSSYSVPLIYQYDFVRTLINSKTIPHPFLEEVDTPPLPSEDFTWDYYAPSGDNYFRLTPKGRYFVKIFRQLGYNFDLSCDVSGLVSEERRKVTGSFSALPAMCLAKLFVDYYVPSAYNLSLYSTLINPDFSTHTGATAFLYALVSALYTCNYQSDYFVSAYDKANGPSSNLLTGISIPDESSSGNYVVATDSSGADAHINIQTNKLFTQYMLDSLKALSGFLKRNQLAGYRSLDRYLAHYGVKLDNKVTNRSYYLGHNSVDIQFEDVMSLSDTDSASLGDYAGRGYSRQLDSDHVTFQTDEFGYFISVSMIIPRIAYIEGARRMVMRKSPLDFFVPEFDALGTEAIKRSELVPTYEDVYDGVFGFTPRYSSYKSKLDDVTGDFAVRSSKTELDSWSLVRYFDSEHDGQFSLSMSHSPNFIRAVDSGQYNRIFYTLDNYDKFKILYNNFVTIWQPMKRLYDVFDFDNENGFNIEVDNQGQQF